jgi:hypothetical protein
VLFLFFLKNTADKIEILYYNVYRGCFN